MAAPAYSVPVLPAYDWGSGKLEFRSVKDEPNRTQGFLTGGECPSTGNDPVVDAVWADDLLVGSVKLCQTGGPKCQAHAFPLFAFYDRSSGSLVANVKLDKDCSSPALDKDRLVLTIHKAQASPKVAKASENGSHLERGNAALGNADGQTALREFRKAITSKEDKALAWLGIGTAQYMLGQKSSALESYQKSIRFRRTPQAFYNLACAQVALNDSPSAIENLSAAVDLGFGTGPGELTDMARGPDLRPLKEDARYSGRFKALLRKIAERQQADPDPR